ncbi:hypothetical protein D0Z07_8532 [Hyphodiscus hymeniophilus]|uniref:Uncharacterized protein n=1 Tax=Hyphodiscus hymeniophilus TaxID=353542 RepID=A0A9P6SKZ9_9HELO|nr:hypothetical protein D0Z07_8532 [Hyphodiscus hymeniophilus]
MAVYLSLDCTSPTLARAEIEGLFSAFGLPWKSGNYENNTFEFNRSSLLPKSARVELFPTGDHRFKALHVKGAQPHEQIITEVLYEEDREDQSEDESEDEDMSPRPERPERIPQAAVAGAKIANGYFVYTGDVNPGSESIQTILALCRLGNIPES